MDVWALGLSCETPAASGPPGLHMTTRELQTCTFERPGASNTTKNSTKGPTRDGEKNENCGGRGKKKARNFGPHPSGPHPSGPPLFLGLGLHPSGPNPLWSKNSTLKNWPKSKLAEVEIGRTRKKSWPKTKLAEVDRAPCWRHFHGDCFSNKQPPLPFSRFFYSKLNETPQ